VEGMRMTGVTHFKSINSEYVHITAYD